MSTEEQTPITRAQIGVLVYEAIGSEIDKKITSENEKLHLKDGLGADSLELAELVMSIEEVVGIEISDADAEKNTTPKMIAVYAMRAVEDGRSTKFSLAK
jgi:acyl carrier protein